MIIDFHTHVIAHWGYPASTLIEGMDYAGIDKAVIFSGSALKSENDFVVESAKKYTNRFIPFFTFDARFEEEGVNQLVLFAEKHGVKGVKVGQTHANSRYMYPMMEKAQEHGLVVGIHSDNTMRNHPYLIGELASSFPKVTTIILHMGSGVAFDSELFSVKVAEKNKNVLLETSFSNPYAIRMAVERIGAERILYGSDATNIEFESIFEKPGQAMELQLDNVRVLELPEKKERLILGENAAKLLQAKAN